MRDNIYDIKTVTQFFINGMDRGHPGDVHKNNASPSMMQFLHDAFSDILFLMIKANLFDRCFI